MKKITIFLMLVFLFPVLQAVEIEMNDSFMQGETLIAKVSGNFVDSIKPENVFFYRGHVRVGIIPVVVKIQEDYYIYSQIGERATGNYSISIEDVRYFRATKIIDDNIVKNFTLSNETASFFVDSGAIISQGDFFINFLNLKDKTIEIKLSEIHILGDEESLVFENSLSLKSGESKKINFELNEISSLSLKNLELVSENTTYNVPIYILLNNTDSLKEERRGFRFNPPEINLSFLVDSETKRVIYLENTGEKTLEDIFINISGDLAPYVTLSTNNINELEKGEKSKIEITFLSNEKKIIQGQLVAKESSKEDIYVYAVVFMNALLKSEEDQLINTGEETCSEMNGEICQSNYECDIDYAYAKDGLCCLGLCEEIKEGNAGKIIGWVIIFGVVVFLIWFFKFKYKKAKKELPLFKRKSPQEIEIKGRQRPVDVRSITRPVINKLSLKKRKLPK
jgi:hypothetical protein